jgi:hypothetical protein
LGVESDELDVGPKAVLALTNAGGPEGLVAAACTSLAGVADCEQPVMSRAAMARELSADLLRKLPMVVLHTPEF